MHGLCERMRVPLVAGGVLDQPYALMLDMAVCASYAETRAALEHADDNHPAPTGYLADIAVELQTERLRAAQAARANRIKKPVR